MQILPRIIVLLGGVMQIDRESSPSNPLYSAIVNSKILGAETLDTSFRSSSMDGRESAETA
jgi:hypothetical protein